MDNRGRLTPTKLESKQVTALDSRQSQLLSPDTLKIRGKSQVFLVFSGVALIHW